MRKLQGIMGLTHEYDQMQWRSVVGEFVIHTRIGDLDPEVPLLVASNMSSKVVRSWIDKNRPIICKNRPHLAGWLDLESRRYSVNGYACVSWGKRDHERFPLLKIPRHKWKVQEVKRVLIAPPGKLLSFWKGIDAQVWAKEQADFFADKNVDVRFRYKYDNRKGRGGRYADLWQDLDWADLVVSWGSAITAEAFWYGKKVISLGPCPTWVCCDRDYANWADPTEPAQRDEWHEHMAWTQFSQQEMDSGRAAEMIVQYQGWPVQENTSTT